MPFRGPYDPADDRVVCPGCEGLGYLQTSSWPPPREREDDTCTECSGRGWVREDELEDEDDIAEAGE